MEHFLSFSKKHTYMIYVYIHSTHVSYIIYHVLFIASPCTPPHQLKNGSTPLTLPWRLCVVKWHRVQRCRRWVLEEQIARWFLGSIFGFKSNVYIYTYICLGSWTTMSFFVSSFWEDEVFVNHQKRYVSRKLTFPTLGLLPRFTAEVCPSGSLW